MTAADAPDVTSKALAWLDARPEPPAPELRQRMAEALVGVKAGTVPGALAEGALACLQSTVASPQERATALDLLAADALLTYALEAAAEIGAAALREMTQAYGPNTLAEVLPEDIEPASASGAQGGEARTADAATRGREDARTGENTDAQTHGRDDARTGENADAQTHGRDDAQTGDLQRPGDPTTSGDLTTPGGDTSPGGDS